LITNKEPDSILQAAKQKFSRRGFWGETVPQMEEKSKASNRQFFVILKGFSLLTLIIGIFGVVNNYVLNFIERKRSLAMYRAIGMSKVQIVKMICIEAFSAGLTGASLGVVYGMICIYIARYIMLALDISIPVRFSLIQFGVSLFTGILISLISSVSPALQSSKLHIIEAIKYE
jgi:putative ABC transport system permease protein